MSTPQIDILMYHSIAHADGPTSIAPSVFADQMQTIADAGVPVISLDDLVAARAGRKTLAPRSVIITFDDGFVDFRDAAWPVLERLGFTSIVYLPTAQMGRSENWVGATEPLRPLMSWQDIRHLASKGVMFGSHTVTHPDLNGLSPDELAAELTKSRNDMLRLLDKKPVHFAPPYGLADERVQGAISKIYKTSVGTRLATATLESPIHDLPRLEMFYFKEIARWKAHLAGKGAGYLAARKVKRRIGQLVLQPWQ